MPLIRIEDRPSLIRPLGTCPRCAAPSIRNYCRECDAFYFVCACPTVDEHANHRRYVWTDAGVVAIPDFDFNDEV